jgi:hypothetical protein
MRVASGDAGSQERVIVTSHIAWVRKWVCAYMYIRTFLDTALFKAVMAMNYHNSSVKRTFAKVVPRWVTSWKV